MSNTILIGMMQGDLILPSLPFRARWKGKNLAVHATMVSRPDLDGNMGPAPKDFPVEHRWCIAHLPTGYSVARFDSLSAAVSVAKDFDSLFIYNNEEEIKKDKDLCELFRETVVKKGGILR
jgi:hypothetical protein